MTPVDGTFPSPLVEVTVQQLTPLAGYVAVPASDGNLARGRPWSFNAKFTVVWTCRVSDSVRAGKRVILVARARIRL